MFYGFFFQIKVFEQFYIEAIHKLDANVEQL